MIQRNITSAIQELRGKFPVITVTGARQTGKTTLLKALYSDMPYVNLEDVDNRLLAEQDPRGFLSNFPNGAVIDEIQQVPALFSYIQQIVDHNDNVHFALSGSQNFQLLENITQSLAGRTAIFNLLPLSYSELIEADFSFNRVEDLIFSGGYPRIFDKDINPSVFYSNYISTYVERDVRQIKNIENLSVFMRFLKLCAGRIGQIINFQSLSNDVGVSDKTIKSWISVLEMSYIIYFHQPHYKNFNKQITKSPKLFFYDTGLACSLLQIQNKEQVYSHYLVGGLFENFVLNELHKSFQNRGLKPSFYFWQSKEKKEIDILIDNGDKLLAFEVKLSQTKHQRFFDNLRYWQKLNDTPNDLLRVIYGGNENFKTTFGDFISWRNIESL
ncbi:MAG: ATP-binding protein [Bacteroidales bacterium]|nr:ATP-binding protein [Bacteroidales bacterium]